MRRGQINAKADMAGDLKARSVWVRRFRRRVLLQKGRHHFRIVLKMKKNSIAHRRYTGGKEDLMMYKRVGVHSAVCNHDPVVYTHWSYYGMAAGGRVVSRNGFVAVAVAVTIAAFRHMRTTCCSPPG